MKNRDFSRKPKMLRVEVTSQGVISTGNTLNVSPDGIGIRLHGKKEFVEGESVLLEAHSHGKIYQMEGIVIWVEPGEPSSQLGVQLSCDQAGFCHEALSKVGEFNEPDSSLLRVIYLSIDNLLTDWAEDVRFGHVKVYLLPPHPDRDTSVMVHFSLEDQKWEVMAKGLVTASNIDHFQVLLDDPASLQKELSTVLPEVEFLLAP